MVVLKMNDPNLLDEMSRLEFVDDVYVCLGQNVSHYPLEICYAVGRLCLNLY